MTRIVSRPIAVKQWRNHEPLSFVDGEETHVILNVLDRWMEMGDWWNGEGERQMIRVWTNQSALFDLECTSGQWFIYKVWD